MSFNVNQGRTARYLIGPLINADGSTFMLADVTVRFMAKSDFQDPDASAVIDHIITFDGTGTVTNSPTGWAVGGTDTTVVPHVVYSGPEDGALTLTLEDEDTETMLPGTYPWEIVMVTAGGDVYQLFSGDLIITDTLIQTPEV